MHKLRIVTTSWDDGDERDMRLADLLQSKGVSGTFYVPTRPYNGLTLLTNSELRRLHSDGLEIGGHSVSHRNLARLSKADLDHEVQDCKAALEQTLGEPVTMFCYPNGRYSTPVIQCVRKAGYKGARTTRMLSLTSDFDPFEMPTSVQAFPHRMPAYIRNLVKARNISSLAKYMTKGWGSRTWVEVGKEMFDHVLQYGGIWHLYGHSWEIDQLKIWHDLAELLHYVSHHDQVIYTTNGQLLSLAA